MHVLAQELHHNQQQKSVVNWMQLVESAASASNPHPQQTNSRMEAHMAAESGLTQTRHQTQRAALNWLKYDLRCIYKIV